MSPAILFEYILAALGAIIVALFFLLLGLLAVVRLADFVLGVIPSDWFARFDKNK